VNRTTSNEHTSDIVSTSNIQPQYNNFELIPPMNFSLNCTASCPVPLINLTQLSFCQEVVSLANCSSDAVSSFSCHKINSCLANCSNEVTCFIESLAETICPLILKSSIIPSSSPSLHPMTSIPSQSPSKYPSQLPTTLPSNKPTVMPSQNPSSIPSYSPTTIPSYVPTVIPSVSPTVLPSNNPSRPPSRVPTGKLHMASFARK